jgi:hypothetical protein
LLANAAIALQQGNVAMGQDQKSRHSSDSLGICE